MCSLHWRNVPRVGSSVTASSWSSSASSIASDSLSRTDRDERDGRDWRDRVGFVQGEQVGASVQSPRCALNDKMI